MANIIYKIILRNKKVSTKSKVISEEGINYVHAVRTFI